MPGQLPGDTPMRKNIERTNLEYYDKLYHDRPPLFHFLHGVFSFDSQSKSRVNRQVVDPIIHRQAEELWMRTGNISPKYAKKTRGSLLL